MNKPKAAKIKLSLVRSQAPSPVRPWIAGLPALTLCLLVGIAAAPAAEFRVGVASVDITPPMGIPMAGYYHERGADGMLDPLHSKAMVIESQGERAALVVLDLIVVKRSVTDHSLPAVRTVTANSPEFLMF